MTRKRTSSGDAGMPAELSAATVDLLGRYLSTEAVDRLRRLPALLREGAITATPSRGKVRAEAKRMAALARALADALGASQLRRWVFKAADPHVRAHLVTDRDAELKTELEALCRRLQYVLDLTGDNPDLPQLALPGRGSRGYADPRTTLVGGSVLLALHFEGLKVTSGETAPAVRCVAAVFADLGIDADAREFVRRELRQYAVIYRRWGGATSPENG